MGQSLTKNAATGHGTDVATGATDAKATEATPLHPKLPIPPRGSPIPLVSTRPCAVTFTLTILGFVFAFKYMANDMLDSTLPTLEDLGYLTMVRYGPAIGHVSYGVGKLSQIVVSAQFGTWYTLVVATLVGGIGLLVFTMGSEVLSIVGWSVSSFGLAHVWAPSFAIAAGWVDPAFTARTVGVLQGCSALGGVGGAFVATAILAALPFSEYGAVHIYALYWEVGGLLVFAALFELIFLRSSAAAAGFTPPAPSAPPPSVASSATSKSSMVGTPAAHPLDGLTLSERLAHMMRDARTWLLVVSYTCFTAVNTINDYATVFLVSLGSTDSAATALLAMVGAIRLFLILGLGAAMDLCGPSSIRAIGMVFSVVAILAQATNAAVYASGADNATVRTATVINQFVLALGVLLPFDLGAAAISMRLGGPKHAHVLIGLFEVPAFLVSALFDSLAGTAIVDHQDFNVLLWSPVACLVIGSAAWWALLALDATMPPQIQRSLLGDRLMVPSWY